MSPVGIGVISRPSEGIDKRQLRKLGSGSFKGHSFDPNEVDPSLWNSRLAYAGDSIKPPAFHPASLGSMGLSTISQLKSLELASCNIFSHSGGNCLDPCISPAHVGIPSPQQRGQMFHGRNPVVYMPASFDGPDRIKNRKNDINTNQCDNKKQYELDIERIICANHFPNLKLRVAKMLDLLQSFNGKKWEKFNSEKVASLAYARIQGKTSLIAHFQNSSLMNEDKRCRPILFRTDGPNAGDQEPFPVGTSIRSRSGSSRTVTGGEENHQGCLSAATTGEASCDVRAAPGSTKDSE
ncbi:hypothetical protein B296_00007056 [Ensete ventricosum]|uniref:Mei2-like C-terminal RNA recognition motif domain-containing protein n=1 Tax=Ensete ventricosum TaxID=4639 RepID=A0A427A909_ENSVE|nr:hypothetical protein B296_00007056 [Ensete ventricosum]